MNLLKTLLIVALIVPGLCGCTQTSPASTASVASPTPTNKVTPTPAVETPISIEPELVGDKMMFTDPTYNYQISFSPDYFFNANPEAMKAALKAGEEILDVDLPDDVGMRFTMSLEPPGSKPMISVLAVAVERVSPLAGSLTRKQYDTLSREHIKKNPSMKLQGPSTTRLINNVEFYRTVYEMRAPGRGDVLTSTAYSHYDSKNRVAYIISYSLVGEDSANDQAKWEEVVNTFLIDEKAGQE